MVFPVAILSSYLVAFFIAIILVLITASSPSQFSCPSPMAPTCNCSNTSEYYQVQCSEFTKPQDLFHSLSNVTSLTLHTNGIAQLPNDIFNNMLNLKHVDLKTNNVILPKNIFSSIPKLLVLKLGSNNLMYLQPGIFHNLTKLRFLKLWGNLHNLSRTVFNDIQNLESLHINLNKMASLPSDLFEDLINLRQMNLQENEFLSLPQNLLINNSKLETFNLQDNRQALKTLPPRLLANLTKLKEVKVNSCSMSTVPEDLLWHSTSISAISMRNNTLTTLPEQLFKDCTKLIILDVSFNQITDLSNKLFYNTWQLKTLLLNNNQMTVITDFFFSYLSQLRILDLKYNRLIHIGSNAFPRECALRTVNMSNNMLTSEPTSVSPLHTCYSLHDIQLANNLLTRTFPISRQMKYLKTLNLSQNQISQLQVADYSDIRTIVPYNINIDGSYNNISKIDIFDGKKEVYREILLENNDMLVINFIIKGNPIICDYNVYSLLHYQGYKIIALIKFILETEPGNLQYDKFKEYTQQMVMIIPLKPFTCLLGKEFIPLCSKQCSCIFRYPDTALIIDCHQKNLTAMPETLPDIHSSSHTELILSGNRIKSVKSPLGPGYNKVTEYIISDNMISDIDLTAFSLKVQVLELDGNSIEQFSTSSINFLLNAFYLTQLTLHNNPWKCDCTTKDLVITIRSVNHLKNMKPLDNITCENGKKLLNMLETELCPVRTEIFVYLSLIVAALGFGLLFGVLAFYYRFQKEIRVWLYAHHCCLWFINEEELDKDKVYDAFVSYAHSDEDFVADHLVPELENGPIKYKLCVHYRDWIVGEFISTQIVSSVEQSRKTIVVLSPDFLNSVWGRMEFRAAHSQALSERRNQVIVIIYRDIGATDKLDSELQAYLTMNTYIKWGDPLFWDKLRYALPHSSKVCDGIPLQNIT